jgi:dihydroflavonol-4-reductase
MRRRPSATGAIDDLDIEWATGDLADPASLVTAMRGCPLVFHAAGYYPRRARNIQETVRHGVTGMRNALSAAVTAGVKRMIYTSALTTIGPPADPSRLANGHDLYMPGSVRNPYHEVKWAMEMEAMRATAQGLQVIIVVPTAVFGPGDIKPTTSSLLLAVAQGRVPGYVEGTLNFVDGRDVAAGHIAAAKQGKPGHRYILGGHNLAIREMLAIAAEAAGRKPPGVKLPSRFVRLTARLGERLGIAGAQHLRTIDHWQPLDSSRAQAELGLSEPIPFEKTCRDTLDWFFEHGYLKKKPVPRPKEPADSSGTQ